MFRILNSSCQQGILSVHLTLGLKSLYFLYDNFHMLNKILMTNYVWQYINLIIAAVCQIMTINYKLFEFVTSATMSVFSPLASGPLLLGSGMPQKVLHSPQSVDTLICCIGIFLSLFRMMEEFVYTCLYTVGII